MSREILFKAKRTDNGEWVEGYLFDDGMAESSRMFVGNIVIEKYHGTADDDWDVTGIDFYEVDPETICQCAGLTGSKFYENDIVKTDRGYIGIIRNGQYDVTHYGFYIEWINGDEALRADFLYWVSKIKSVGNIFDYPELLEQEG